MNSKCCTKCGKKKALGLFPARKDSKSGKSARCRECHKQQLAAWYANNKEHVIASSNAWRAAHPERIIEVAKAWLAAHPGYNAIRTKAWREANRKRHAAMIKAWRVANPGRDRAHQAKRRATKLNATPPWVDLTAIAKVYARAAKRGLTVDHIIPLNHPRVCGLHVPWNLQLLTENKNNVKGNRWEQP